MRTKKVPKALRVEMGAQLANYFGRKSALDEKQVIACLPPKHQKELIMAIYAPFIDCPLLQGLERGLTCQFCLAMRPYFAFAGDVVVLEGEIGEEMYLITRGTIKLESVRFPDYNSRSWEDGAFFGELPLLDCGAEQIDTTTFPSASKRGAEQRRVMHVYTATALVDSHCTYVTREDLNELIKATGAQADHAVARSAGAIRMGVAADDKWYALLGLLSEPASQTQCHHRATNSEAVLRAVLA